MKEDFSKSLKALGTQKYRSIIVHHDSFRALEQFALGAAKKYGGGYCDLLAHFKNNPDIHVDAFDVEDLSDLLKTLCEGQSLLCVDKINFLLDTWSNKEQTAFYSLLRNGWNSFYPHTRATLVFFIQSYDEIREQRINDTHKRSRIRPLSHFKALT
jgi:hypothetical protein